MQKRILLVNFEMSYTGSPRALYNLAECLLDLGNTVDVWTINNGPFENEFLKLGIVVKRIDDFETGNQDFIQGIKEYDLIFANTVFCSQLAFITQDYVPTILYIHEASNLTQLIRDCGINDEYIRKAKHILCVSEYARECILSQYGTLDIDILMNWVRPIHIRHFNRYHRRLRFLVSGTYEYRKGQDVAECAYAMLPDRYRNKAELHFVGEQPEWSAEYTNNLKRNQTDFVFFHDAIKNLDELLRFYLWSDVIIVSSRDESCSLVALEAAMLKKCLLVTQNTGARYIVDNKSNILRTADTEQLRDKMQEIIDRKMNIRKEGRKNYRLFKEYGLKEKCIKELDRIIYDVLIKEGKV